VWYHVPKGRKIFFLIEPTEDNLHKFEEWRRRNPSPEQDPSFFGDLVDACFEPKELKSPQKRGHVAQWVPTARKDVPADLIKKALEVTSFSAATKCAGTELEERRRKDWEEEEKRK